MIKIDKNKDIQIILSERLDSMNADEAKEVVIEALSDLESDVIIDVTNLLYISSAGLQVILKCAKTAQEHHKECFLKGATGTVREIFQVSGFLTFLKEIQ
jgi:anti-anti-sigma factor